MNGSHLALHAILRFTARPDTDSDPYPDFRSFCLDHSARLKALVSTRLGQTNEVGRCSHLLPAFNVIAPEASPQALSVIEVGASAGLLLLWDKYGYRYGARRFYGNRNSPVQINCDLLGGTLPPITVPFPHVQFRRGIDLNPTDLSDPEEALWLRACIWPEHHDRADLLQAAVEVWRQDPPQVLAGDGAEEIARVAAYAPGDTALVIFHSQVYTAQPRESYVEFKKAVTDVARTCDLYWLSAEGPNLDLMSFKQGKMSTRYLAKINDPHGKGIAWRESDEPLA